MGVSLFEAVVSGAVSLLRVEELMIDLCHALVLLQLTHDALGVQVQRAPGLLGVRGQELNDCDGFVDVGLLAVDQAVDDGPKGLAVHFAHERVGAVFAQEVHGYLEGFQSSFEQQSPRRTLVLRSDSHLVLHYLSDLAAASDYSLVFLPLELL